MMKFYSLSIGALVVGVIVLALAILFLSKDMKIINNFNKTTAYLTPNITYITLGVMWLLLSVYLGVIIKLQLM